MGSHRDKPFLLCPWILVLAKALGQGRQIHIQEVHKPRKEILLPQPDRKRYTVVTVLPRG